MTSRYTPNEESKIGTAISYLLMIGVIISLSLNVIGMISYYESYGSLSVSEEKNMIVKGQNFFSFIYEFFQGRCEQNTGVTLMIVGIVILILTPYVRVVTSSLMFAWQRNTKYVLITLFVLIVLTYSLVLERVR